MYGRASEPQYDPHFSTWYCKRFTSRRIGYIKYVIMTGSPLPYGVMQDLSHRNETLSTKIISTSTPIIQAITVHFLSKRNPNTYSRQHQDMILTMWKSVTISNRGRTSKTLL